MNVRLSAWGLLIAFVAVSCGENSGNGIFNKMRRDKRTYVATVPFEPPLLYQRGQELVGAEVELARRIVARINERIETVPVELYFIHRGYGGLIPALQNQEAAFAIGVFGVTEAAEQLIDFSESYYESDLVLIIDPTRKDIRPNQLSGVTIGVRTGTAIKEVVQQQYPQARVQEFNTLDDAVLSLRMGEIDAAIDDRQIAAYVLDTVTGMERLEIIPSSLGKVPVAIGVRKGERELLNLINQVIAEVQAEDLYAQWIEEHSEGRVELVETRHPARLAVQQRAQESRRVVIRVSKDPDNPIDIYRMANLNFVLTNEESGQSHTTSRINFQGRVGVSQVSVPPGSYALSLPRLGLRDIGTVFINPTDPDQIAITIRLRDDNRIEVSKG